MSYCRCSCNCCVSESCLIWLFSYLKLSLIDGPFKWLWCNKVLNTFPMQCRDGSSRYKEEVIHSLRTYVSLYRVFMVTSTWLYFIFLLVCSNLFFVTLFYIFIFCRCLLRAYVFWLLTSKYFLEDMLKPRLMVLVW